jgi:hypothetical protein
MTPCNLVDSDLLLKMKTVGSSETSVKICQTTRRHIAEYSTLQFKQLFKNGSKPTPNLVENLASCLEIRYVSKLIRFKL